MSEPNPDLLALVHKWRASATANIRRGRGYKAKDRHKAIQALAMAGGLRICAADLEAALGIVPAWVNDGDEP